MRIIIISITTIAFVNSLFISKAFGESNPPPPPLSSETAIIIEANTGTVIYGKNASVQMYPASITKIATAIYAIETADLNEKVTVSNNARSTDGSTVYLETGEKVPLKQLVQGLLINSGNDAGVAIAEHVSGSVEQFSSDINLYLQEKIGVQYTNFENPHGLFDPDHVTTAEDFARITQYAIKNETFRDIFGTEELKWDGMTWDTTLITHHKLVKGEMPYDGVTGGKNGFVNQSGYTLATTAEREGLSLIVITMKSDIKDESYNDTIKLLDYGFENYTTSYIDEGTIFKGDDKKFVTADKIAYTHPLNAQMDEQIGKDGSLKIINQDGSILDSFTLDKVGQENKNYNRLKIKRSTNEEVIFDKVCLYLFFCNWFDSFNFNYLWSNTSPISQSIILNK